MLDNQYKINFDENNNVENIVENSIELNNELIDELKNILNLNYNIIQSNKDIINDVFDDDVKIIINDEIFVDVNDDEFIDNIFVICIINDIKGSLNVDEIVDKLNYYIYHRFIIYHDYHNFIHQYNIKDNKYNKNNDNFYYNSFNYNIMNYLYIYLLSSNIYLNYEFNDYQSIYNFYDINDINKFLIYEFDNDVFDHDIKKSYVENYNELIDNITVFDDVDEFIDNEIDEIFEINNNLKPYINYDDIIYDIVDNYVYYEYKGKYFYQCLY